MEIVSLLTTSNIIFAIGIIGTIFTVYNFIRNPQEDIEKKQIGTEKDIADKATILQQKEVENKATLLAQQVEWEKCANEKKFAEFGVRLDSAMNLAQNHIHTVDVKCDKMLESINAMGNKITELSTIINERIPKQSPK